MEQGSGKESPEEFFLEEQELLARYRENVQKDLTLQVLSEEYKLLGSKYDILLRQTLKLMRIGDSNQRRLIKTQNELQEANHKLEVTYKNLKSLSQIGKILTATFDTKEIVSIINKYINKIMDLDILTIGIYEEEKNVIKYKSLMINHEFVPSMVSEDLSEDNFSSRCVKDQTDIIINDIQTEAPEFMPKMKRLWDAQTLSMVYIPLTVQEHLIGILSVQSYETNAYNENKINILRTLASYIAIAIDNANAYKDISKKNKQLNEHIEKIRTLNDQLEIEMSKSEKLLLNILPSTIAERLKKGESVISDYFPEASVLFADIAGFTKMSAKMASQEKLVDILNEIFTTFDNVTNKFNLEKIKTIGDCFMVAGGIPAPSDDHLERILDASLEMIKVFSFIKKELNIDVSLRIGVNVGPIVAGVIGKNKFVYDLWGDTVNTASRMESNGMSGRINCSIYVYEKLHDKYHFEDRGELEVKGKGPMRMFFLNGKK
ncbi:MAG: GAF domain-containing protein [Leptospiraceae bacterium]|nr:GAF domain-containing protein [Leptospiraceae bacterium]